MVDFFLSFHTIPPKGMKENERENIVFFKDMKELKIMKRARE